MELKLYRLLDLGKMGVVGKVLKMLGGGWTSSWHTLIYYEVICKEYIYDKVERYIKIFTIFILVMVVTFSLIFLIVAYKSFCILISLIDQI